jgi:LytS/YehU family sensor histidine kinase
MRNTLIDTDKIYHSLDKEIKILSTYLKLEQLRFEFDYNFKIDESININEIEFPGMLLQPLVENAVRHGVSGLRGEGEIIIHFYRNNHNLIVEIKDNGNGFEDNLKSNGFGCKLTADKIKLLNKLSGVESITKNIFRKNERTVIQILFKNKL